MTELRLGGCRTARSPFADRAGRRCLETRAGGRSTHQARHASTGPSEPPQVADDGRSPGPWRAEWWPQTCWPGSRPGHDPGSWPSRGPPWRGTSSTGHRACCSGPAGCRALGFDSCEEFAELDIPVAFWPTDGDRGDTVTGEQFGGIEQIHIDPAHHRVGGDGGQCETGRFTGGSTSSRSIAPPVASRARSSSDRRAQCSRCPVRGSICAARRWRSACEVWAPMSKPTSITRPSSDGTLNSTCDVPRRIAPKAWLATLTPCRAGR